MGIVSWAVFESWVWIISGINWPITVHPDARMNTGVDCIEPDDQVQDDMGNTAITFILLFLITLLFSIVTTAFKVIIILYIGFVQRSI